ncbi:Uncharacterised protein [Burkholderia pseudomallei]|nr:Uncharacterised protein [Burkholderia pseudomallei]
MSNDSNDNKPNVSGLTPTMESLDGIAMLRPTSLQKSLVGINSLRPNASGVNPSASPTQSTTPIPQASGTVPTASTSKPAPTGK